MAAGSSSVSLNGFRSSRGVSFAILVSIVSSWFVELNSTAGGAASTVTLCWRVPGVSAAFTVTSPPGGQKYFAG